MKFDGVLVKYEEDLATGRWFYDMSFEISGLPNAGSYNGHHIFEEFGDGTTASGAFVLIPGRSTTIGDANINRAAIDASRKRLMHETRWRPDIPDRSGWWLVRLAGSSAPVRVAVGVNLIHNPAGQLVLSPHPEDPTGATGRKGVLLGVDPWPTGATCRFLGPS